LYVDGNRSVLPTASCSPGTTATQFNCSAILPPMNAGTHTIELATFVMSGGNAMESSKSAPLSVTASGLSSATPALPVPVITDEQVQLKLTPVADGLNLPTDLAVAPDGSLFVAERGGTVRLIRDGVVADTPALDISNQLRLPEGGLLSIALDPKFEETGLMFALYAAEAPRDGLEFVLARFRSVNGVFADRAVLLDRIPASTSGASGAVRVGPDGKTYVAMDSSADQRVAGSFATYNGKVLRLNADATTPADQSGSTPIFSLDHPQPNAMDWQPSTGTLWVVDRLGTDAGRLSALRRERPTLSRKVPAPRQRLSMAAISCPSSRAISSWPPPAHVN
jgi:glucose/arabinose dehydrogenase